MANFDNELKTGLWAKKSKEGNKFYSGKIKVAGLEYWVNLYETDEQYKTGDNPKDFTIQMRLVDGQEQPREETKSDPYQEVGDSIEVDEHPEIEISDDDLPF